MSRMTAKEFNEMNLKIGDTLYLAHCDCCGLCVVREYTVRGMTVSATDSASCDEMSADSKISCEIECSCKTDSGELTASKLHDSEIASLYRTKEEADAALVEQLRQVRAKYVSDLEKIDEKIAKYSRELKTSSAEKRLKKLAADAASSVDLATKLFSMYEGFTNDTRFAADSSDGKLIATKMTRVHGYDAFEDDASMSLEEAVRACSDDIARISNEKGLWGVVDLELLKIGC